MGSEMCIRDRAEAVRSKKLLGAAVDVFPVEPRSNDEEFITPLREFDNVILTPHVGGSTMEAQANIGLEVAEKLGKYSDNGTTISAVNFPEVALPAHPDQHRILHVHQNKPGIMNAINSILAENDINICSQYLQTFGNIGYVVIDIDAKGSEVALDKIQTIEGTIKVRRLF